MVLNICCINTFRSDSNKCQIFFSILIIITCVFNLICARLIVHEIDDWSDVMSTSLTVLQSRVVAVASLTSRLIILYKIQFNKIGKYKTTLESFDIYSPMTADAFNQCKWFSFVVFSICLTAMIPTNFLKLYNLYNNHPDGLFVSTYFFFFYLQNFSMCLIENHFTSQCFMVYKRFRQINDDLKCIKVQYVDYEKFPFLRETVNSRSVAQSHVVYDKDFYCPKDKDHPLANVVEILKIRHWLTREAVLDINNFFTNFLGLSVFTLCVLVLFDIYVYVFHYFTSHLDISVFRSKVLFSGWILQYSFRFCVIAITSNITTKQVTSSVDLSITCMLLNSART